VSTPNASVEAVSTPRGEAARLATPEDVALGERVGSRKMSSAPTNWGSVFAGDSAGATLASSNRGYGSMRGGFNGDRRRW
jgi:hypothetical protein